MACGLIFNAREGKNVDIQLIIELLIVILRIFSAGLAD